MNEQEIVVLNQVVGHAQRADGPNIESLSELPEILRRAVVDVYGSLRLSPPQQAAQKTSFWNPEDGCDLLLRAPTASGKTLVAELRMFAAAINDTGRSLYVVPLKALALQKVSDFRRLATAIAERGGPSVRIGLATGDAPAFGEEESHYDADVAVCTPERLEILLRQPDHRQWSDQITTCVFDEVHLLGDPGRGAVYEWLLMRVVRLLPQACLLGMSATLGDPDRVSGWFARLGRTLLVLVSEYRYPRLQRQIVIPASKAAYIDRHVQQTGQRRETSLIFVYRRRDAEKLAERIAARLGPHSASCFHAGLTTADRMARLDSLAAGKLRVMVATTALKLGLSVPVTTVVIRDHMFPDGQGGRSLSAADVLQMMGRAGRDNVAGRAVLLCRSVQEATFYRDEFLRSPHHAMVPRLIPAVNHRGKPQSQSAIEPIRGAILTLVASGRSTEPAVLTEHLMDTFSGYCHGLSPNRLDQELCNLEQQGLLTRHGIRDTLKATPSGAAANRAGLSPETAGMLLGVLHGLSRLERQNPPGGPGVDQLGRLDFCVLAAAAFEAREGWLSAAAEELNSARDYIERLRWTQKPVFWRWCRGDQASYPRHRLLESLRIPISPRTTGEHRLAALMKTAIVLDQFAGGMPAGQLAGRYGVTEGLMQTRLLSVAGWILNGLAAICGADPDPRLRSAAARVQRLMFGGQRGLGSGSGTRAGGAVGPAVASSASPSRR